MDKTASYSNGSVSTPSQDLVKIAQKLADAEQLALVKEAEMYGAGPYLITSGSFGIKVYEHESLQLKWAVSTPVSTEPSSNHKYLEVFMIA